MSHLESRFSGRGKHRSVFFHPSNQKQQNNFGWPSNRSEPNRDQPSPSEPIRGKPRFTIFFSPPELSSPPLSVTSVDSCKKIQGPSTLNSQPVYHSITPPLTRTKSR